MSPKPSTDTDEPTLEQRLAEKTTSLERLNHDLDLARTRQRRLAEDRERLERTVTDLEDDRRRLREELSSRDQLLDTIFRSRSWRLTQAVRRALGRH